MKRKIIASILVAIMGIASLSACDKAKSDNIKLGLIGPLTGGASIYGNAVKNGIDLAISELNANGGILNKQISLEAVDDKNDIAEAVTAYNNLMSKKIDALIGTVTSKPGLAVAELAANDKTPMLTPTGTAEKITTTGDNIFRVCFTDPIQGKTMATFAAKNLGAKNVAIMYNTSDDYSQGVADNFSQTIVSLGGTVVANEGYGNDDKDFRAQLTKIQALNPDVLFLPDYYNTIALITTQAREVGFNNPILGADGWDGVLEVLDESNKKVVDNCYFSNHYSIDDPEKVIVDFISNYKSKYNEVPNAFAALAYDATYIMANAIKEAGSTDKDAINNALKSIKYNGVTGSITFNANGDPIKSVSILRLQDGKTSLDSKITVE